MDYELFSQNVEEAKNRYFSSKILSNSLFSKGLLEKRLFGAKSINS